MTRSFCHRLVCAAVLVCAAAQSFPAVAQSVPRVKARLVSFEGQVLTLERLDAQKPQEQPSRPVGVTKGGVGFIPAPSNQQPPVQQPDAPPPEDKRFTVAVLPSTQYVGTEKSSFSALSVGAFAGASVSERRNGRLTAKEVYLYPEALRGAGEGRFPDVAQNSLVINGTISAVQGSSPQDNADGTVTLHYRGSVLSQAGSRTLCEGRASPPAFSSPLACSGDALVQVGPGTPVTAMSIGGPDLLVPGAIVSVAMAKNAQGDSVTPGVIVEKPQSPN